MALFSTICVAQDTKNIKDFKFIYKCASNYSVMSTLKNDKESIDSAKTMAKAYVRTAILIAQNTEISKDKMMQMGQSIDNEMSAWLDQQKAKKIKVSDVGAILDSTADKCTERIKGDQYLLKFVNTAFKEIKSN